MRHRNAIAKLLGMGFVTAISSTAVNAQVENFDITGYEVFSPGYSENTPSVEIMVEFFARNSVSNGPTLPLPPPTITGEVQIYTLDFNGSSAYGRIEDNCTRGPTTTQGEAVFACRLTMLIDPADRQKNNLDLWGSFDFNQDIQGVNYSSTVNSHTNLFSSLGYDASATTASIPQCPTEAAPMLPTTTSGGSFVFTISQQEVCSGAFFIDPPVSTGFDYTVTGAKFTSVTMPSMQTVPDPDGYIVTMPGTNIVPVRAQPGRRVQLPFPASQVRIRDIDPALQLDPANSQAFAMGVELTTPTGNVTITQTAETTDYTPPPAVTGLMGDDVLLRAMNYAPSTQSAVVSAGLEFSDFQGRFDVDVSASKIRIDLAHPHGGASYGNGYFLNLLNLNPNTSGCSGVPFIQSIATSTSKADADITRNGASHTDNSVSIPLAPVGAVLDWDLSDWIEVDLTFGCRAGPPINPMGGELRQAPGAVRSPPVLRRPPPPPPPVRQTTRTGEKKRAQPR